MYRKTTKVLDRLHELDIYTPNRSGYPLIEVPLADHEDIDVGLFRRDAVDMRALLHEWDVQWALSGTFRPWELGFLIPWAASGRAIGLSRTEGFTKLVFDEATHRIVGAGIVGVHAGELIAEAALAIEMGCEVADIGHTIHPHPTLSESVGMAAEVFDGTITDLYLPKKK